MFDFTKEEVSLFRKLNSPKKIQDFLNNIPTNFEYDGETVLSPRRVLKERRAHCMEGAMLAATILRFHGQPPLVLDLTATKIDEDHVVTLFKQNGHWGAVSKSNHATLRYREPVYKTIRELVMSYFHEYYTSEKGIKTLRSYAGPINLARFDKKGWTTSNEDVWYIPNYLEKVPHKQIISRSQIARLRRADDIELRAGKVVEWEKKQIP